MLLEVGQRCLITTYHNSIKALHAEAPGGQSHLTDDRGNGCNW